MLARPSIGKTSSGNRKTLPNPASTKLGILAAKDGHHGKKLALPQDLRASWLHCPSTNLIFISFIY